jgi:hypothetical protein
MVAHACYPSKVRKTKIGRSFPGQLGQKVKRAQRMAQVVEQLPSKHKALNSNPSITTKKKKLK